MKPGKELDRLIIEKVCNGNMPYFSYNPSIYIEDAWAVVGELISRGFRFALINGRAHYYQSYGEQDTWSANFGKPNSNLRMTPGESPAHAICLAALKALEIPYET